MNSRKKYRLPSVPNVHMAPLNEGVRIETLVNL
jgi:hypothetical protein